MLPVAALGRRMGRWNDGTVGHTPRMKADCGNNPLNEAPLVLVGCALLHGLIGMMWDDGDDWHPGRRGRVQSPSRSHRALAFMLHFPFISCTQAAPRRRQRVGATRLDRASRRPALRMDARIEHDEMMGEDRRAAAVSNLPSADSPSSEGGGGRRQFTVPYP